MATAVKRKSVYSSYGNAALEPEFAPDYSTGTRTEPLVRPRERVAGRQRVKVRQAGYVSPTAVIGFAAVAVMAIALLISYAHITMVSDRVVKLRNESATLADEHAKLLTQYELVYDLKGVEEQVVAAGTMRKPVAGQEITLDLSEPDSAQVYESRGVLEEVWESLAESVENIAAFFR